MAAAIGADTAITAGAVISGAYFGDLMTPLSETTILTPQIVGSNVYAHIKNVSKTTIPSYLIALVIFFLIGRNVEVSPGAMDTDAALEALSTAYNISLWNILPVLVLLMLAVAGLGSVMSSTGVVAIFIPVVMLIAERQQLSPGRLMMPLMRRG